MVNIAMISTIYIYNYYRNKQVDTHREKNEQTSKREEVFIKNISGRRPDTTSALIDTEKEKI